jgi:hypothetical protein
MFVQAAKRKRRLSSMQVALGARKDHDLFRQPVARPVLATWFPRARDAGRGGREGLELTRRGP